MSGARVQDFDERIRAVHVTPVGPASSAGGGLAPHVAVLTAAMSAAALAGGVTASGIDRTLPLEARKKEVDGAATRAAERVFGGAPVLIRVTAGEGERDDSPGALVGQRMGGLAPSGPDGAGPDVLDGVFDYVDGTRLAADNLPGALALGSLGRDLRPVPDLQAYAVLAPREVAARLDITGPPEEHAPAVLAQIAEYHGKPVSDLTVLTHSGSSHMHDRLTGILRASAGTVIVPEAVSVEPPYLLSLIGLSSPRIDTMIGSIGMSELAFAATLLDLVCPGYSCVFRPGSVSAPRANREVRTLAPLFGLSPAERRAFDDAGLAAGAQHSTDSLVTPGTSLAAAVFAVTPNPLLGLAGPGLAGPGLPGEHLVTEGLVFEPGAVVSRLSVSYERHPG